jgi:hypothetical protein
MSDSRPDNFGDDMIPANQSNPAASMRRSLLKGLAIAGGVVSAATMRRPISGSSTPNWVV